MNDIAKDVVNYYYFFALCDSKLAVIDNGRDYSGPLATVTTRLQNITYEKFSNRDAAAVYANYYEQQVFYFEALIDLLQSQEQINHNSVLFANNFEKFVRETDYENAVVAIQNAIRYLHQQIGRTEGSGVVNKVSEPQYSGNIFGYEYAENFKTFYKDYENIVSLYKRVQSNEYESTETILASFHQGMTHLCRFVRNQDTNELKRFNGHLVRAILDIKKFYLLDLKIVLEENSIDISDILLEFLKVKNTEVPGTNSVDYHVLFTKYNSVIEKFEKKLDESGL